MLDLSKNMISYDLYIYIYIYQMFIKITQAKIEHKSLKYSKTYKPSIYAQVEVTNPSEKYRGVFLKVRQRGRKERWSEEGAQEAQNGRAGDPSWWRTPLS